MAIKTVLALGLAVVLTSAGGFALSDPDNQTLVGTWRLVSMARADENEVPRPYWGDQPLGLLIYTADGHVSAQVYDARRRKLGVPWDSATPEAAQTAFAGLATYFGTYSIDSKERIVTHTVQGAMSPDWIGAKLVRSYRFISSDQVELSVVADAQVAAIGLVLTWERVK